MPGLITNSCDQWTATVDIEARADEVLRALTDPEAIAMWAPVAFDVEGLAGGRLRPGSRERVSGSVAGVRASFMIEVLQADERQLELVAEGPLAFHVRYSFTERRRSVLVNASVALRNRDGLTARLLRPAVGALLNAGALCSALRRLQAALAPESRSALLRAA
jgi:hypothetical protein